MQKNMVCVLIMHSMSVVFMYVCVDVCVDVCVGVCNGRVRMG